MARFLVSLLVLLSAMSLVISLTIPTRTSPTRICEIKRAAGRVPVVYDEVENPIETASDTAHPEMDLHTLESPQAEIQLAVDRAVEMARRTYEILGTIGIEQTPEFLAFFGVHHDQQALTILRTLFHRVADLDVGGTQIHFILRNQPPHDDDNTAHTFAHTDEEINRITIWERTWRELGPHRNVVPQLEADVVDIDEQVDAMQSWATVILHELVHLVGGPNFPRLAEVLNGETTPRETSNLANVLQLATNDPFAAIRNPESLANYATAIYYNLFVPRPDTDEYAPMIYPVQIPDPFDQLTNLTVNNYDLFSKPAPPGASTWWLFKSTGMLPDNFLRV